MEAQRSGQGCVCLHGCVGVPSVLATVRTAEMSLHWSPLEWNKSWPDSKTESRKSTGGVPKKYTLARRYQEKSERGQDPSEHWVIPGKVLLGQWGL